MKTDETIRVNLAIKATDHLHNVIQCIIVTIWGYYVLKDTTFMPWFMGGSNDSQTAFGNIMKNCPFTEFPTEVYHWLLYAAGGIYLGNLVNVAFL